MIIVTGCAGFIGSTLVDSLVDSGHHVIGIDNFDPFYAKEIKVRNMEGFAGHCNFSLLEGDLRDPDCYEELERMVGDTTVTAVVHLAAKAGVRPSILDPEGYAQVNISATRMLLDFCASHNIRQFVFASSSSVYGLNPRVPWSEDDEELQPISPYATTKISGELIGQEYSRTSGIRFVGLRLFTVYGPRQRPDLAISKFFHRIESGLPVELYGNGSSTRDYTYIGDVIAAIRAAITFDASPCEVINIGNDHVVRLDEMVRIIERILGKRALITSLPSQQGDVPKTWACLRKAQVLLNYRPTVSFEEGLERFSRWRRAD
jgi:UDP-glucuronate 4-epimerase